MSRESARQKLPKALFTFSKKLEKYLTDPVIIEATELYEKAFDIFERIRGSLRLNAKGASPVHELYELSSDEYDDVSSSLDELRKQFTESIRSCSDSNELKLYEIVEVHLKKYGPYLFPGKPNGPVETTMCEQRTALNSIGVVGNGSDVKPMAEQNSHVILMPCHRNTCLFPT